MQIILGSFREPLGTGDHQIAAQPVLGCDINLYLLVPLPIHNYRWREFPEQVEPNNGDTGFMFGFGHGDLVEIAPLVLRAASVITREK